MKVTLESMIPSDAVIEKLDIKDLFRQFCAFKPGIPMLRVVKEFLEAIEEVLEEQDYVRIRLTVHEISYEEAHS